jgi:DNA-directed RNA polymerase specialized sigma subunit
MRDTPLKRIVAPLKRILGEASEFVEHERSSMRSPNLKHIEDAFLELKDKERLVLALRYYEKLTENDVASVLQMKLSEVRRIQRSALDGVVRHLAGAARG